VVSRHASIERMKKVFHGTEWKREREREGFHNWLIWPIKF